MCKVLYLKL